MTINWEEFDKTVDTEGLAQDVINSTKNKGMNKDKVPYGDYEVKITKLELTTSKTKGEPMVTCWFKILTGPQTNKMIFMYKVVTKGYPIHQTNEFLESLLAESDSQLNVEFKNYSQYSQLIYDVAEAVMGKFEYVLNYKANDKGYDEYKITQVFVLE